MGDAVVRVVPADEEELREQLEKGRQAWKNIGALEAAARISAAHEWADEYGHLFYWCCGQPVLSAELDEVYDRNQALQRGDGRPRRVFWDEY